MNSFNETKSFLPLALPSIISQFIQVISLKLHFHLNTPTSDHETTTPPPSTHLSLVVRRRVLWGRDDHIGHAVAEFGRVAGVAFLHLVR